jgi:hypothetical protein
VPYKYEKALSEKLAETAPGGSFAQPWDLTFDASGNLLLADPHHLGGGVIDKFDAANVFQAQFGAGAVNGEYARGVAVDDSTGDIYVGDSNSSELFVLDPSGALLSQWTGANTPAKTFGSGCCFVYDAVDNSSSASKGDVYVMRSVAGGGGEVDVFETRNGNKEEGAYLRQLEVPSGFSLGAEFGLAVNDSTGPEAGEVYVTDSQHDVVDRFSAAGVLEEAHQITGISPGKPFREPVNVAVDDATGDVFVVDEIGPEQDVVDKFSPSGELLGQITGTGPSERFTELAAVAVQEAGANAGDVYVTDVGKQAVDVFAPEVPAQPTIEAEGVSQLSSDSASFDATIDPHGAATEYRFEYGPCTTSTDCASSPYIHAVPAPDASLEAEDFIAHNTGPLRVTGLTVGAPYHFRVVTHNSHGELVGAERTFSTQPLGSEFQLPDGRVWELISPPAKQGASISQIGSAGVVKAAADGTAITYLASGPTEAEVAGSSGPTQVLSTRGNKWSSRDLTIAHVRATGIEGAPPEYQFFSEDLTSTFVQPLGVFDPAVAPLEASEQTPYLQSTSSCTGSCFHPLVTGRGEFADVPAGTSFGEERPCEEQLGGSRTVCGPTFWEATPNGQHAVLSSAAPLTTGAGPNDLYEWTGGALSLVSVLPPNEQGEELPVAGGNPPQLGANFGTTEPGAWARRAISADGSRVMWEWEHRLYLRDLAERQSLQIDAAEPSCLAEERCASGGGHFQIASVDGSRVYFTDERRLTSDAGAAENKPDLYECLITEAAGKLVCDLTDLTPSASGESMSVQGDVLGASEDGSTVYFVADGVIDGAPNASQGRCINANAPNPPGATCNLYVRHLGRPIQLVAVLAGEDKPIWSAGPPQRLARVAPNGQWLAFMSLRSLTGYDNRDAISGHPDAEAYLYDADAARLLCASCDPTGARPAGIEYRKLETGRSDVLPPGSEELDATAWTAALLPHATASGRGRVSSYQSRYLSDSGRLFFNSADALVPQDVNGTGDVYEFEPSGVGGCTTNSRQFAERSGGCIGLISAGTSSRASSFLDASESGGDVFFLTTEKLKPEDVDILADVYDAHECTAASPCGAPPAATPPVCVTEASCKAPPTLQPGIFGAPSSATFSGPGNLIAAPARPKSAAQVRAERLSKALRACKKDRRKLRRLACERQARRRYPVKTAKKSNRRAK